MKRPAARRLAPNYFAGRTDLTIEYSSESWSVKFYCKVERMWQWERLETLRVGPKLEAEAKAAALKLIRASADRWNKVANDAFNIERELRQRAATFENARRTPDDALKLPA